MIKRSLFVFKFFRCIITKAEFEKQIIDILKKSDMQIDELSRELKRNVSEINTKLIMLEVKGLVKKLPGSKYQLKL